MIPRSNVWGVEGEVGCWEKQLRISSATRLCVGYEGGCEEAVGTAPWASDACYSLQAWTVTASAVVDRPFRATAHTTRANARVKARNGVQMGRPTGWAPLASWAEGAGRQRGQASKGGRPAKGAGRQRGQAGKGGRQAKGAGRQAVRWERGG
eukprot:164225-Chlamydomonas_euryale.AAC.1